MNLVKKEAVVRKTFEAQNLAHGSIKSDRRVDVASSVQLHPMIVPSHLRMKVFANFAPQNSLVGPIRKPRMHALGGGFIRGNEKNKQLRVGLPAKNGREYRVTLHSADEIHGNFDCARHADDHHISSQLRIDFRPDRADNTLRYFSFNGDGVAVRVGSRASRRWVANRVDRVDS